MASGDSGHDRSTLSVNRRELLLGAGALGTAVAAAQLAGCAVGPSPHPASVFSAGIASGLHSSSEVVIWTRADPRFERVDALEWELASNPSFTAVVARGSQAVDATSDHTVKVLVGGLDPDRPYWYRFTSPLERSAIGHTRTLPLPGANVPSLRMAVTSCQCFTNGFYASWRDIARTDLDAVLFLGDYIYEAALPQSVFGVVRPEPLEEAITLEQYREKYRWYKTDPDLQAAHAAHPFVPIWDDHEVANDYDAALLLADPRRAQAAYRAWFEYQPVWPISGTRIHRDLQWGDLARIFMLDTRQHRAAHRSDAPLAGVHELSPFESAPGRSILGADQRRWLFDGLTTAQLDDTTWKIVGNQVMLAPIRAHSTEPLGSTRSPLLHAGYYTNTNFDSWDGFPWERDLLLRHLHDASVRNTVVLSGDYHSFWQSTLSTDFDDPSAPLVANEFAVGAISSGGGAANESIVFGDARAVPAQPPFRYADGFSNGYGLVDVTADRMQVDFMVHDAEDPRVLPHRGVRFTLPAGSHIPTIETRA